MTMNQQKGQIRCPDRGRFHGIPPTKFDDATITNLFDNGVLDSIHRDILPREEF